MTDAANGRNATIRRTFSFSLRDLFVLTTCVALFCGLTAMGPEGLSLACLLAFLSLLLLAVVSAKWRIAAAIATPLPMLVLLMIPAVAQSPEAARRAVCLENLRTIGRALRTYQEEHGHLPPAVATDEHGKPLCSWRVLILPYLGEHRVYKAYHLDEPWDSPHNRKLSDQMPAVFRCPTDHRDKCMTSYCAVTGPGTLWSEPEGNRLSDAQDDLAKTLLVVETCDSQIPWTAPRDLDILTMPMVIKPEKGAGISSKHRGVACVLFADGNARPLSASYEDDGLSEAEVRALLTASGGEDVDLDRF